MYSNAAVHAARNVRSRTFVDKLTGREERDMDEATVEREVAMLQHELLRYARVRDAANGGAPPLVSVTTPRA
ncbi:hypothetical protein EON66_12295 [archaeon]|nr:MAG: hypothetical protein EON66_12295 [archaeon]